MYKAQFEKYIPKNVQEENDKQAILNFIERNPDCLFRTNLAGHITSSAIVVNKEMTKVLFAHHNIYNSWGWVGGHNDGNPDLLQVAIKETKEETGISHVYPYSKDILMIDVIYVYNHMKNNKFIGDHLHFNATYLMIADEAEELKIKHDENSGVKWFMIDEVYDHITEPRMIPIYQKAFDEIKRIKNK